jgi:hypothetical protein
MHGIDDEISWRLAPLDDPGLPVFIKQRALPDAATTRCELCNSRPRQPFTTILIVDGPDGLPVPFLICAQCRRTLDELHALLESRNRQASQTYL